MYSLRGVVLGTITAVAAVTAVAAPASASAPSTSPPAVNNADEPIVSPASLAFGEQYIAETGTAKSVTVTGTGTTPINFGNVAINGVGASSFVIISDTCTGATLTSDQTCKVNVAPKPTSKGTTNATLELPNSSSTTPKTVPLSVTGLVGTKGTYYPLTPTRIMDTRSGNGAPAAKIGPGGTVNLQVTGRGGVPSTGVGAVVLNVTVTGPTSSSVLTVYPAGQSKPTASSLNFLKDWTRSNSVTVAVGANGRVTVHNHAGSTHAIVDVTGFYASDNSHLGNGRGLGGQFLPVTPYRVFDSRSDWEGEVLDADSQVMLGLNYGSEANRRMRAAVVNITAVSPKANGFLTAWNGEWPQPDTSTVNYTAGSITPNLAVVPIRYCYDCPWGSDLPTFGVYTLKDTHVIVDIVGFLDDGNLPNGLRFEPKAPTRIVDSREGQGLPANLGHGVTGAVTTPGSVMTEDTWALSLNVTAVTPTTSTFLKLWPNGINGIGEPDVSNLNVTAGQVVANAAVTLIGPANKFNVKNHAGTTGVVVDVVGNYWLYPGTASTSTSLRIAGDSPQSPYKAGNMPKPVVSTK